MKINRVKSRSGDYHYYLAKSVRKGNKTTTVNVESLGKHSDLLKIYEDPFESLKLLAKEKSLEERLKTGDLEIKFKQSPLSDNLKTSKTNLKRVGHFYLNEIIDKLNLKTFFNEIKTDLKIEYNPYLVTKFLIIDRIISPKSKYGTFNQLDTYYESPSINLEHFYKTLDLISDNLDNYQQHLYKNSLNVTKRDTRALYYDCTNFYFETNQESDLAKYGFSKDSKAKPIVGLGLFMDSNGIPLAFDVHSGNTNEQTTAIPLEKKIIKDFGLSNFIYIADAGLNSNSIRGFNSFGNRDFIVTDSLKKFKSEDLDVVFNDQPWYLINDSTNTPYTMNEIKDLEETNKEKASTLTFYKDFIIDKPVKIGLEEITINNRVTNKTSFKQRAIVTYQPKYKFYQERIRLEQLERANKLIETKTYDKPLQNSPKRLIKVTSDNKNVGLDIDKVIEESKYDGFYALATSLFKDSAEDIIRISAYRWKIEDNMRALKFYLKTRPIYHRKENRIEAHLAICFTSLLVLRLLEKKLDFKYTTSEILNQIKTMKVIPLNEAIYKPTYTGSELLKDLDKAFGKNLDKNIFTNLELNKNI